MTSADAIALRAGLFLFAAGLSFGQTTRGLIAGRVVDSMHGLAVAGARISYLGLATNTQGSVPTDTHGYYAIPLLPPGPYRLRITADGYQPQEVHELELPVAARLDIGFRLRPLSDVWESGQYGSFFLPDREGVLTFYGPDVDTSRAGSFAPPHAARGMLEATISQVIDPTLVRDLPLAGRDIYTTLILQPGVASGTAIARGLGLSISGQRPTASNFLLDGVENNNYLVSGPLMAVAPEAVQEYRISTNNFSAEYGRTSGVLANAVTHSGGNQWHGLSYVYAKNTVLNGNDFQRSLAGLPRPALRESQPGVQAGGPILKNRLFLFASLEYLRSRGYGDPVTARLPTTGFFSYLESVAPYNPGAAYTIKLLQDHPFAVPQNRALSAPVTLGLPSFVDRWLGVGRMDYALPGGKHRLMARIAAPHLERPDFLWSPYQGFNAPLTQKTLGIVATLTSTLTPGVINEARLSWTSDDLGWDRPHSEIPTLQSSDQAILPGSLAFYSYRNRSRTWELADNLTWIRGRHLMQFGGGILLRSLAGYLTAGRDGRYTFHGVPEFATGSPMEFSTVLERAALPRYRLPSNDRQYRYDQFHLFAQDTFRVTPRLTVNYGLRYENFGAPSNTGAAKDSLFIPGDGAALLQRIGSGRLSTPVTGNEPLYGRDNRGWAARLGASYDLTGKGRSLFRCAYGVFYDRPFDNLWANVRLNGSAFETFDITADSTNFLAPALPQLAGFVLQPINTGLPDITWIDSNLRNAYVQSFFAGLSREVSGSLSLELNGTGTLGRKLITTDILNRGFTGNPQLPQILYRANQGSSNYSAFTALGRYRSSRTQFLAAYTWSHSIDNQSSPLAGDFFDLAFVRLTSSRDVEHAAAFTQQQNSGIDRGNSDFDQRHNLAVASIVELPAAPVSSRFRWLLRDWRLATLASFRTGLPYTVYAATGVTGIVNRRADLMNPALARTETEAPGGRALLNRAAFADPAALNGNLGRNSFAGPGLFNIDLSLNRAIRVKPLGEAGRLNFRADAFNFLNHANLGNPDANLSSDRFGSAKYGRKGQPTGFPGLLPLNETARQVQIMVKLEF